jgi:lipase
VPRHDARPPATVGSLVPARTDPFTEHGGALRVGRAGPAPAEAEVVVLAVHGISASHLAWRAVVRDLVARRPDVCVLAPDLRGRGRSAHLPPPERFSAHVGDMVAVLDHAGVEGAVLAGHSMGAYVVAALAADHPDRAASVLLLDGGLPIPLAEGADPDEVLDATLGPAIARLRMTFESPEAYVAFWQKHPSFAGGWTDDLDAYVRYDLAGEPGAMRSVVSEAAVRADGRALLVDDTTRTAAERVGAPLAVVRAPRGLLNDENVLIPDAVLEAFAAKVPHARTELVPEVNHYTLVMGDGAGKVADAIEQAISTSTRA